MDNVQAYIDAVSGFVWGPYLLIPLLLLTGVYLTIRVRGIQFTQLWNSLWLALVVRLEVGDVPLRTVLLPHHQRQP